MRALARVYLAQKDFRNAEATYRKILQDNPGDIEVLADLGDAYLAAQNVKAAEKEYSEIKRLGAKKCTGICKARRSLYDPGQLGQGGTGIANCF